MNMKIMVISDIHGGLDNLKKCLNIFEKEKCDRLLVLGDLFEYGFDINRFEIISELNKYSGVITAVRGNCDININGINFDMPRLNKISFNNITIVMSHGDLYDEEYLLNEECDIILLGHSHKAKIENINGKKIINPGSIYKSRNGENSFAIIEEKNISIRNIENKKLFEYKDV